MDDMTPAAILAGAKARGAIRDWVAAENGYYVWHNPPMKPRLYSAREVVALASMPAAAERSA